VSSAEAIASGRPGYLTPAQFAVVMGVSGKTVERWLAARGLEHVKIHRVIRIPVAGAAEFVLRRTVKSSGPRLILGAGFDEGSEFWGRMERLIGGCEPRRH
jgi:excisionase family DNA binding protein